MASTPKSADSLAQVCPAETLREIALLLGKLFDIYKNEFPELIPNELHQISHIYTVFNKFVIESTNNPLKMINVQRDCAKDLLRIFNDFNVRVSTLREHKDLFKSFKFDKRFANQTWYENPYFELLKRLYYLVRKYSLRLLYSFDGLDHNTRQQMHFYIVNFLNFFAPTNYLCTNPEVLESIVETGGRNLLNGIKNYLEDLVLNEGKLNVRMTDLKAFKVGQNLAATPGKVIYQNDLMQLIQYSPTTEKVYSTPILFTPPWINKFYILDLSQKNSLVKWLVNQGFTVFMISWINADEKLANKEFSDYMIEGPIKALDVITKETNVPNVHMVGYCIGGTLLACTLAYMAAKNDKRAKTSTFFMSLVNFSNPGEIGVFLDAPQLDALDEVMEKRGYLNGRLLDITFNTLRPNELIWPYFIHNYLLGKPSKPFDLLYWNADSSNLPYKMYSFYLRNMYLHNKLRVPGGIVLANTPIDLGKITTPSFFLSSEGDHITLWRAIFSGVRLFGGECEFILSESGHVRAVVNPPGDSKYGFITNAKYQKAADFHTTSKNWLEDSTKHDGSWWPYWVEWILKNDNQQVAARLINPGSILEDAPGSYVQRRI